MKLDICLSWMLKQIGPRLRKRSQPWVEFGTWSKSWNSSAFKTHCKHLSLVLAVEPGLPQGLSCNAVCMEFSRSSFKNLCHNCICKEVVLELAAGLQMGSHNGACIRPQAFTDNQGQCCIWPRALKSHLLKDSPSPTPDSEPLCHSLLTETHIFLMGSLCSRMALIVHTRKWLARANSKTGCEQSPDDCREFKKLRKQAGITFSPFTSSTEIYLGGHF